MKPPIKLLAFASILLLCVNISSAQNSSHTEIPELRITVNRQNIISAAVKIAKKESVDMNNIFICKDYDFYLIALPFHVDDSNIINSEFDTDIISIIKSNYSTIILAISQKSNPYIIFNMENLALTKKTVEGKSLIQLDLSYDSLSEIEKEIINQKSSILNYNIYIRLPEKYDINEITCIPSNCTKYDAFTYFFPVGIQTPSYIRLIYPNPITKTQFSFLTIVLLFGGILSVVFREQKFKHINFLYTIVLGIISFTIIGFTFYYLFKIHNSSDLLNLVGAVALPNAVYTIYAIIYFIVAKYYQVSIAGLVTVDGDIMEFVSVSLSINDKTIKTLNKLDKNGRFIIYRWQKLNSCDYNLKVTYQSPVAEKNGVKQTPKTFEQKITLVHKIPFEIPKINIKTT